jgi:phage FluMu protein Com
MRTVQLQCGNCQKLMAIAEAHLGGQVQCPHCQAVVQTPKPAPAPVPEPPPAPAPTFAPVPSLEVPERDSIFGQPEQRDDLFDEAPASPLVEMPTPRPGPGTPPAAGDGNGAGPAPAHESLAHDEAPAAEGDAADLSQFARREIPKPSLAPQIALIFLVPYAILTTLFIIYLLATQNRQHPLDLLPDPRKDKGGPRAQVQHDLDLAPHQKVALGQTRQVGDIEVTPQRVRLTREGNLVLALRVKNISDKWTFNPIHDDYLKFNSDQTVGKPYTFLQPQLHKRIYGGYVEWLKGPPGHEKRTDDGDLRPGQDEVIQLTTPDGAGNQGVVQAIAKSSGPSLWRVQLRRGPVDYRGEKVSATTVIGVQFGAKDIQKDARDKAPPPQDAET